MIIEMKEEKTTHLKVVTGGYLQIAQESGVVALSGNQVHKLLAWLKNGSGMNLDDEWNGGVDQVES